MGLVTVAAYRVSLKDHWPGGKEGPELHEPESCHDSIAGFRDLEESLQEGDEGARKKT